MGSKTIKLLFTSIGRRVELVQQFKSSAARLGVRLIIIGADISSTAPALAFCDKTVIVPRISDREYIPALIRICEELEIDGVIPTIDTDLYLLSCEKQRFVDIGTTVFISAPEKIAICRDKRYTADYFHSLGLTSPSPVDDVEQYRGGFPAFIKPFNGSSSIGAHKAETMEELRFFAAQLSEYVVQPYVSGVEYTVDVFCDLDGEPVFVTPRIRQAVRAGEVLKTKIHHEESIVREMLFLVKDYKPCGGITVQLIRDEDTGTNSYIEINPRFGGGAPLTMKAGADSAEAVLRILLGEKLTYIPNAAAEGAVYSRFDQSVCISRKVNRPIEAVVFDLDDTLYSEKEYVKSGFHHVAAEIPDIASAEEKLWNAFRNGLPAIDYVLRQNGLYSDELKQKCLQAYRYHIPTIHLYEGAKELLQGLHAAGVKIGIITDGRPEGQQAKIQALGLESLVDSIIITDELGGIQFRKPNDISFRVMQKRFEVPFDAMVYIGDNPSKDFQAPKALGMQWVYYKNSDGMYSYEKDEQHCAVDSFSEVVSLLRAMPKTGERK